MKLIAKQDFGKRIKKGLEYESIAEKKSQYKIKGLNLFFPKSIFEEKKINKTKAVDIDKAPSFDTEEK